MTRVRVRVTFLPVTAVSDRQEQSVCYKFHEGKTQRTAEMMHTLAANCCLAGFDLEYNDDVFSS